MSRKKLFVKLNGGRPEREILFAPRFSDARHCRHLRERGGVGKSSMTANLAAALARQGLRVGVMDADIYGSQFLECWGEPRSSGH